MEDELRKHYSEKIISSANELVVNLTNLCDSMGTYSCKGCPIGQEHCGTIIGNARSLLKELTELLRR